MAANAPSSSRRPTTAELSSELEQFGCDLRGDTILAMEKASAGRDILGISATLLPYQNGKPHWDDFAGHVNRTEEAGLIPAVNMDTGYRNLLTGQTAARVLQETHSTTGKMHRAILSQKFVAGAFVKDDPGAEFNPDAYVRQMDLVRQHNGFPVIFQSYGLTGPGDIVGRYEKLAERGGHFYAFELGKQFAPFGEIYDIATYKRIMEIDECMGAKHSSLVRNLELQRLALRDVLRPDFKVFTGNDYAPGMPRYGSDYLLGLSTFHPEAFAARDRAWAEGDIARFEDLDGVLAELGNFSFRDPVPAYKHSAAHALHLQGHIATNETHPNSAKRPDTEAGDIRKLLDKLERVMSA